jgi:hypothetical protein
MSPSSPAHTMTAGASVGAMFATLYPQLRRLARAAERR